MKTDVALMTKGSIYKQIVAFALPIFWGQLFQQLYNIVDSVVVGHYVGRSALAAVTSTGSLVQLIVGLFVGIFMGAGVVISKYFGAENHSYVRRAVHATISFGIISGIILTGVGVALTPQFLKWMGTPADVFDQAVAYLRIYFMGGLFLAMYNATSGIFQAVGDSRHPLYYLIISSLLNVVLDLLLVAVFHMGVEGAAIATVFSQFVGVVFALTKLGRTREIYRVQLRRIGFDRKVLGEIIRTGLPSGIQNSVISIANVVVQSNINAFGSAAMAGCGAFSKAEGLAFIPITSFSMAMSTFIGQNLGAQKYSRAKKGARFGIAVCCVIAELCGIAFYFAAPYVIALFNNEAAVLAVGTAMTKVISPFFFMLALSHCAAGIMRGAGRAIVPMLVMLTCWCVIRVSYLAIMTRFIPKIEVVFWAYPLTWFLSSAFFAIYLLKSDWVHSYDRLQSRAAARD